MQFLRLKQKTILLFILIPIFCLGQAVKKYEKLNAKVIETLDEGEIHLSPLSDNMVRIQYGRDIINQLPELVFTTKTKVLDFNVSESTKLLEILTSKMTLIVDKQSGVLSYRNDDGTVFLIKKPGSRLVKN
jgi:alpha-D-xyloside xylohydrolase